MAKGMDLASLERGRLRHPLFGMRGKGQWFNQPVPPGWWSKALSRAADDNVRREIIQAMDRVARKVTGGV